MSHPVTNCKSHGKFVIANSNIAVEMQNLSIVTMKVLFIFVLNAHTCPLNCVQYIESKMVFIFKALISLRHMSVGVLVLTAILAIQHTQRVNSRRCFCVGFGSPTTQTLNLRTFAYRIKLTHTLVPRCNPLPIVT